MSHTPTPWTWAKWDDEPTPCIIGPEGDERICEMNGNEDGFANAELIVQAVNAHQALKEALAELLEHEGGTEVNRMGIEVPSEALELAKKKAHKALALTKGDSTACV